MENLWNLVDKWNLSTKQAILVFLCIAALVIVLCIVMALRVKRARKNRLVNDDQGLAHIELAGPMRVEPRAARWGSVKKVLMGSVRWSGATKLEESRNCASRREKVRPLLAREGVVEGSVGWRSRRDMVAPVWQRPILMGEKCELPRYSGLILYDERGRPLDDHSQKGTAPTHQEDPYICMVGGTRAFVARPIGGRLKPTHVKRAETFYKRSIRGNDTVSCFVQMADATSLDETPYLSMPALQVGPSGRGPKVVVPEPLGPYPNRNKLQ